jgi:hypothetical protein
MSELELLQLVLTATQQKRLNWKQAEGQDVYLADVDKFLYIIDYQEPILADGKAADVALIKVSVAGVLITCAAGTPCAELVEQILAAAFPEWAETAHFMEEARMEAADRLVALLNGTTEEAERLFSVAPSPDWTNALTRLRER